MAVRPTYPGVYIQEVPSPVRTIIGVSTSVTAFVGYLKKGPMDEAVQIFNFGEFEREFGGLDTDSEISYAIQQFFLNGGTEAWVVRTASGNPASANVQILDGISGSLSFTATASNHGEWGNHLRISIDDTSITNTFNLNVSEFVSSGGILQLGRTEVFRNLTMSSVQAVVNDDSQLIQITDATGVNPPLQTGTVSGNLATFPTLTATSPAVDVTIGSEGTYTATFSSVPTTLKEARSALERAIRASRPANPAFASATVEISNDRLRVLAGPITPSSRVTFSTSETDPTATELTLTAALALSVEGVVSGDLSTFPTLTSTTPAVDVTIGTDGPHTATFAAPANLNDARTKLETAIREANPASAAFTNARVAAYSVGGDDRLIVVAGVSGQDISFAAAAADPTTVTELTLDSGSVLPVEGIVSGDLSTFPTLTSTTPAVDVTIGTDGPHTATFAAPANLNDARTKLEIAIREANPASAAFSNAIVAAYSVGGDDRLIVVAGASGNAVSFTAAPADSTTVTELRLDSGSGATANVQAYTLGQGAAITNTAQGTGTAGNNGTPPDGTALIGDRSLKTGLFALEDVDIFNILCIPRTAIVSGPNALTSTEAATVIAAATNYCEEQRAFFIVDAPVDVYDVQGIKEWLDDNNTLRHQNLALYFPRLKIADPQNNFRLRSIGASGTMAGLYARIDSNRGVWKAPAGTEAVLRGAQALDYKLTDPQNGTLNPLGINSMRTFPVYGNVCWGARTLMGADQLASEWKYIPIRRLALFMEESLYRGTQWVVFEPNDEPLWAQIRLNVGAFMHNLYRQGAFQGSSPSVAYFVKCDGETTTQNDRDRGIVNILVGFAPLKPAEFVIISISQIAGDIQT